MPSFSTFIAAIMCVLVLGACQSASTAAKEGQTYQYTDSGLGVIVFDAGNDVRATIDDQVKVHYAGYLEDGTLFDSSYEREQPATFGVDQVIAGFAEAVTLIGEGGKIKVEIPAELGYGEHGSGNAIPPHATLYFVVELIEINP